MIDHIGFPVSDYERAKAFYLKALAPLEYTLIMEVEQETEKGFPAAGFGRGKTGFLDRRRRRAQQTCPCRDRLRRIARRSTPSIRQHSPPAERTTARPASVPIIIRIITQPSCSIRTDTTSRRCVTNRNDRLC